MVSRAILEERPISRKAIFLGIFTNKNKNIFYFDFLSVQVIRCQELETVLRASLCITFKIESYILEDNWDSDKMNSSSNSTIEVSKYVFKISVYC